MVLMPFSIPQQVPLLLSGEKKQTTRQPRKEPLKVGDVLQCYYRPRVKKSCETCIRFSNEDRDCVKQVGCPYLTNYFGDAVVESIVRVRHNAHIPEYEMANFMPLMSKWSDKDLDAWAVADGFTYFSQANIWFTASTGLPNWKELEWDIITFEPRWL